MYNSCHCVFKSLPHTHNHQFSYKGVTTMPRKPTCAEAVFIEALQTMSKCLKEQPVEYWLARKNNAPGAPVFNGITNFERRIHQNRDAKKAAKAANKKNAKFAAKKPAPTMKEIEQGRERAQYHAFMTRKKLELEYTTKSEIERKDLIDTAQALADAIAQRKSRHV